MDTLLKIGIPITMFVLGVLITALVKDLTSVISILSAVVSVTSGFVVAIASYILVEETRKTRETQVKEGEKLRELQTAPDVSISFTQPNAQGLIYILIRNDGAGTARNITFNVNGTYESIVTKLQLKDTFFIKKGINYLVPNQEFRALFSQDRIILNKAEDLSALCISTSYQSDTGKRYEKEFINDFSIIRDTILEDSPVEKIARELSYIHKSLEKTL